MTEDNDQAIGSGEFAVIVEMGEDFVPGERTAAALRELALALQEEHGDDVAGFASQPLDPVGSFTFAYSPEPDRNFFDGWPAKMKIESRLKWEH